MLVGATVDKTAIAYWQARLPINQWMRIFPNSDGLPPPWTDERFAYMQAMGGIPFISTKIDGNATKLQSLYDRLLTMPSWITTLYLTDRHEPEGDSELVGTTPAEKAASYKANFTALWNKLATLPAATRAKIRCGPVLTNLYTEDPAKGNYDYKPYDPGIGDFFGVDMYGASYSGSSAITSYKSAAEFLQYIKPYKYSPADVRMRIFPEIGYIGAPFDTTGSMRAAWLSDVYDELKTWGPSTTGWSFGGFIWWNDEGTSGSSLTGIGTRRWFQLDRRHNGQPYTYTSGGNQVTDPQGGYVILSPAPPVNTFNAIAAAQTSSGGGTTDPEPEPDPGGGGEVPPPPSTGSTGSTFTPRVYVAGPEFRILVTNSQLKVVTRPIYDWLDFDATVKFNAAGTGTVTAVADPALLAAVSAPNNRICVVRNPAPALGIAGEVLVSGPIERPGAYAWSVEQDDESDPGKVTVGFTTNEVYLAERITFPAPTLAAGAQGTDYFTRTNVNAESLLRELVNLNAGPGALAARRVPLLQLGLVAGVGSNVSVTTRFDPLTDVLRELAKAGGNLGWRVRDTQTALLFEVYAPTVQPQARFGRRRGNVRAIKSDPSAPTATVAIAGGTGEGAGRLVVERAAPNPAGWRRMETFVNQNGVATTTGLEQYADTALAEKAEKAGLAVVAIDPYGNGYGTKYRVGQRVPVELPSGLTRVDTVLAVRIQATPGEGSTFTPQIGSPDPTTDPAQVRTVRDMQSRLGRIERR